VVERYLDTVEVTGSNPVSPTAEEAQVERPGPLLVRTRTRSGPEDQHGGEARFERPDATGVGPATGSAGTVGQAAPGAPDTLTGMTVARSILLFGLAAVAEIGGAWLIWQGVPAPSSVCSASR
jgi:Uncharacterised BCR, YnfA/UPF0060 family